MRVADVCQQVCSLQLAALQLSGEANGRQLATHRPPCKSVSAVQGADLVAYRWRGDKVTRCQHNDRRRSGYPPVRLELEGQTS